MNVILYEPEIAPNTGNIIRLCANTGAQLHLIHPLGFEMDEKRLRRAGLDYLEFVSVKEYDNYESCISQFDSSRIFAATTHAIQPHTGPCYQQDDVLLFGPETRGLPVEVRESLPDKQRIRIPMVPQSRSMNLSNAVAVVLYEALRQRGWGEIIATE
ncbi:MAG: tRNA (cytidine(34)-2'-O)-methyltransferase [Gammaproteobacteria bacterium]|nr:tRNA (cytidine(34)-2'-O)-methyltransferase [Gammaproteobacteria bacterium]MBT4328937.1 tRNA (cytidine(34)-2'-O)-methyltransferase [Gammaproteobacteria bacterium]MBT5635869.1 tRNA (cytidine(34)-2'-O)-methyltransferase [Gammaproteobacteria bacterium]